MIRNKVFLGIITVTLILACNIRITTEVQQSKLMYSEPDGWLILMDPDNSNNTIKIHESNKDVVIQLYDGIPLVVKHTTTRLFNLEEHRYKLIKQKVGGAIRQSSYDYTYKVTGEILSSKITEYSESKTYVDLKIRTEDKVNGVVNLYFLVDYSVDAAKSKFMVGGLVTLKKSYNMDKNRTITSLTYSYEPGEYGNLEFEPE